MLMASYMMYTRLTLSMMNTGQIIQIVSKQSRNPSGGKVSEDVFAPENNLLGNWEAFLRADENKSELFKFVTEKSIAI